MPLAEDQIAALVRLQLPQPPLPGALLKEIADELQLVLIEILIAVLPDALVQDLPEAERITISCPVTEWSVSQMPSSPSWRTMVCMSWA